MRRDAREAVCELLYSYMLTGETDAELRGAVYKQHDLKDKEVAFADSLISAVKENAEKFNDIISELSVGYDIERIFYIDKAAMMIAMAEISFTDTDVPVIIDEANNLIRKYSSESILPFVNGVLAEFLRRYK